MSSYWSGYWPVGPGRRADRPAHGRAGSTARRDAGSTAHGRADSAVRGWAAGRLRRCRPGSTAHGRAGCLGRGRHDFLGRGRLGLLGRGRLGSLGHRRPGSRAHGRAPSAHRALPPIPGCARHGRHVLPRGRRSPASPVSRSRSSWGDPHRVDSLLRSGPHDTVSVESAGNSALRRPTDTHSSRQRIMCGGQLTNSYGERPALV